MGTFGEQTSSREVVVANSTASASRTVPAGYALYVPQSYEIGSGLTLEIAASAIMEIG